VIAGPNGSGKTTLTRYLQARGVEFGEYINPDDIAASLQGSYDERVRAAQQIADKRRDDCIASRRDFAFETVMSHPSKIDVMRRARAAGFHVTLFFVGTDDPRINIARVNARVALGGHSVREDLIVARYHRTMEALIEAALTADRTVVFDNSRCGEGKGLRAVLELCFNEQRSKRQDGIVEFSFDKLKGDNYRTKAALFLSRIANLIEILHIPQWITHHLLVKLSVRQLEPGLSPGFVLRVIPPE
jgi:predicted ABC-type ATPase